MPVDHCSEHWPGADSGQSLVGHWLGALNYQHDGL